MRDKLQQSLWALMALALLLAVTSSALASERPHDHGPADGSAFATILDHYEGIRQVLLADTTEGLAAHAKAIADTVQALREDFSNEQAGVQPNKADEARGLLPDISLAAAELVATADLETARQSFYSLSKVLVRYRKLATGDLPVVAYCSMAKKSWLQPAGEIGNPYLGPAMITCGEVVDD